MRRALGTALCLLVGVIGCSSDTSGPTVEPVAGPRAPSVLTPTATSPTAVTLSWRDLATDETGYRIERSLSGGNDFATVGSVAANIQTFIDRTVSAGQTYDYQARAVREQVVGDPSNVATVIATTNASPTPPNSPTPENRAQDLSPDAQVVLSWTASDPDGDELLYDVLFGPTFGTIEVVSTGQTTTEYTPSTSLDRNRSYFWQVVTRDPAGIIRRSPVWVFSTVVERQEIPGGDFVMGSPPGTLFAHPGNPVRTAAIDMDRYEITNAQFVNYLNQVRDLQLISVTGGVVYDIATNKPIADVAPVTRRSELGDQDSAIGYQVADSLFFVVEGWDNFPAVEVSWYGANGYASFFGRRLPSEAEWEKAARGTSTDLGTQTFEFQIGDSTHTEVLGLGYPYPWGEDPDNSHGNFDNSGDPFENQSRVRSTPVGYFDGTVRGGFQTQSGSSVYGCDDMAGNVWEWTNDAYDPYQNPHRPPTHDRSRVIRGGGYELGIRSAVTWNRSFVSPDIRDRAIGFRTVKDR